MKKIYFAFVGFLMLLSACSSPVNDQHNNRRTKANTFQNNSDEATTEYQNTIGSGNLTDSTQRTDTSGKQ